MHTLLRTIAVAAALAACAPASAPTAPDAAAAGAIAHQAHEAYVTAINSNDVDTLLADLTDDVVYLSPHEPALVGKAAVRRWLEAYFGAYTAHWEKTTLEFIVAGDWGIERYSYRSTDTPRAGGAPITDAGKGINIYHRDADGRWRVARDAWSTDLPLPTR
jgi:ketosteroid isomerase-like protein